MKTESLKNRILPVAALSLLLFHGLVNKAAAEAIVIPSAGSYSRGQGGGAANGTGGTVSVLERFRTFTGQRTVEELTALFCMDENSTVRQLPSIALSDGRTAVIIVARIPAADGRAINFSIEGGTMISLKGIKTDEWEIRALPETGGVKMSLLVLNGSETVSYPLIVAPELPSETDLSSCGVQNFLDEGQTARDLNNDGRHDYLDDYIVTANFLVKKKTTGRDKSARQQRAIKRTLAIRPEAEKPEFDPSLFAE